MHNRAKFARLKISLLFPFLKQLSRSKLPKSELCSLLLVSFFAFYLLPFTFRAAVADPLLANSQTSLLSSSMLPFKQQAKPEQKLIDANTQFGFKLFSAIASQNKAENVFISPTSVAIALSMLYQGAGGKTQQEMAEALEIQGMSLEKVGAANQALRDTLQNADPQVTLAIANSLWAREGVTFKPSFLNQVQQYFDAQITRLNFANPEAKTLINNWVKEKTQGKIDQIIDSIHPSQILFLINAIYFKGNWTQAFEPTLTSPQPFHLADGKVKSHPLMARQGEYQYYENQQFQAVSLPYAGKRLSFYVFLPRQDMPLEDFLAQLTPQNWNRWISEFRNREGLVKIPRFKLEYEIKLNEVLSKLGMSSIFNASQANFSPMTATPVRVDEVKHKTFVEVNEEGTEAAAVTSIGIRATSMVPQDTPFRMVVDRPFFCAIRDNQTGTLLFMGAIANP
jgi:serpin B